MGLLDFMKSPDINEGVKTCAATPGAALLDVRNPDEYAAGHIPGSVNLPLSEIKSAASARGAGRSKSSMGFCFEMDSEAFSAFGIQNCAIVRCDF